MTANDIKQLSGLFGVPSYPTLRRNLIQYAASHSIRMDGLDLDNEFDAERLAAFVMGMGAASETLWTLVVDGVAMATELHIVPAPGCYELSGVKQDVPLSWDEMVLYRDIEPDSRAELFADQYKAGNGASSSGT